MLDRSSGPEPKTSLGDGRTESLRRASIAKFVVSLSGSAGGSFLGVGRRSDGLKRGWDSFADAIAVVVVWLFPLSQSLSFSPRAKKQRETEHS